MAQRLTERASGHSPIYVPTVSEYIRGAIARGGYAVDYVARRTGVAPSVRHGLLNRSRRTIPIEVVDRLFGFLFHHPPRRRARPFT